tara:strand:+ start:8587 stop:9168 length:582 start_codon:yes stop_codon:yes gene_type:complete
MRRRNDNKKVIWAAFIGFIMISSVFGVMFYGFTSPEDKIKYNDFVFTRTRDGFTTEINKKDVSFFNFPEQVEDINIDNEIIQRLKNTAEIDITYDENNTYSSRIALIEYNLEPILRDSFNIYLRKGFATENSYNLPVINCSMATPKVPVLYFRSSDITRIYLEDDCIIAEADAGNDFLRIADRLLYGMFDIIK